MSEIDVQRIEIRGLPLAVARHGNFWDSAADGSWEASTFDMFDAHLPKAETFVDLGAWIGPTSLYAARYCRRIISFEPDPTARKELTGNIHLNPSTSEFIVRPEAIAASDGTSRMWDGGDGQGQSTSSLTHGVGNSWDVSTISARSIRSLIPEGSTYFVKMDIEAGEYSALDHIAPLLGPGLVGISIAFHPQFIAGRGAFRRLKTLPMTYRAFRNLRGFRIYRLRHSGMHRAIWAEFCTALRLPLFEAHKSYLFVPRRWSGLRSD